MTIDLSFTGHEIIHIDRGSMIRAWCFSCCPWPGPVKPGCCKDFEGEGVLSHGRHRLEHQNSDSQGQGRQVEVCQPGRATSEARPARLDPPETPERSHPASNHPDALPGRTARGLALRRSEPE